MKKSFLERLPNFSDQNYVYASFVCGVLVSASSLFFIYEMFTAVDFGIEINWNIFKSAWFTPLFTVGFIFAIINWGKFWHWSGQPYNVYKDSDGKKYVEKNNDITDNMFGHFIMPLLGHFVIEPIIYACIIYYPLMLLFAILGIILPYVITLVLLAISVFVFISHKYASRIQGRSFVLILATLVIAGGLTWISLNMENAKQDTPATESVDDMFDSTEGVDDMFDSTEVDMFDEQDSDVSG